MNDSEKGVLYVVATPIGNLKDITYRAVETLRKADMILAEDTRVSSRLLVSLNIKANQKLISCHDFNEEQRIQQVKQFLNDGKNIALVSDAGTPLISDPGYKIVSSISQEDYKIVPIPGVSAVITALSVAGLPSDSFMFKGFLSAKKSKRREQISNFKQLDTTIIVYEAVHRVEHLFEDLSEILPEVNVVLSKELTKQYETFVRGKPCEIKSYFMDNPDKLKGEYVVIIDCNGFMDKIVTKSDIDEEQMLKSLLGELPLKKAVSLTTKILKLKKNKVYQKALDFKREMDNKNV